MTSMTAPRPTPVEELCEGLIEAGWLAAMAVVPLFFNPYSRQIFEPDKTALLRLIVLEMCAAWAIKVAGGGRAVVPTAESDPRRPRRVPMLVPSLFVLISTALSVAWSVDPGISIAGSYHRVQGLWSSLALVALFVLMLSHLRSALQWRRILYAVTLSSFGVACYAVAQALKLDPVPWVRAGTGMRVGSTLGNPIFLAAFLGLTFFPVVGALANGAGAGTRRSAGAVSFGALPTRALLLYTLGLQILAIAISRSRGPLLGVLTGSFLGLLAYLLALRARSLSATPSRWRALRRWSWLILIGLAAAVLVAFWVGSRPWVKPPWLRGLGLPRMAAPFNLRLSSARTRLLGWESGLDLLREGSPVTGRSPMPRVARALVGYGPETFRLVIASHDSAERSRNEDAETMVPDRGHNEVLDRLVETGVLGFSSWFFWFGTLFFLGATGLFPRRRFAARLYWPLLVCGALVGTALPALLGAPHLAFFGVPVGMLAGVAVFLALLSRDRSRDHDGVAAAWSSRETLIAALFAAAAAHLVEINLGIAVTATKLYLWCLAAMLVATRQGWLELAPSGEEDGPGSTRDDELPGGLIAGLVVATLVFPLLANPNRASTSLALLADNFANRGGVTPVAGPLWLPILVWVTTLATAVSLDQRAISERAKSASRFAATSLVVAGAFLLYHAHRLSRTVALEDAARPRSEVLDHIAGHAPAYQTFVLLWVLAAGALLWRRRAIRERRVADGSFCRRPWRAAAAALLMAAVAVPVIEATMRPLAADALLKQGTSLVDAGDTGSSLPVLRRAAALAPREPTYRYELARALVVSAQSASVGPEREELLREARSNLELARSFSPLDPESSGNLGSLFAIEAGLAVDGEARRASLARAAEELEHALELRPEWVHGMADLAVVEHGRGNRDRAFELADRALALDPSSRYAYRALAHLHTLEVAVYEAAGDERAASDHRARAAAATERAEPRGQRPD